MNTALSRLLRAGVLAGGLLAVGAGVAHADETASGQLSLSSGNQVAAPIQLPSRVDGNPASVRARAHVGAHRTTTPSSTAAHRGPTNHAVRITGRDRAAGSRGFVGVTMPVPVDDGSGAGATTPGGTTSGAVTWGGGAPAAGTTTGAVTWGGTSSAGAPAAGTTTGALTWGGGTSSASTGSAGSAGSGDQVEAAFSAPTRADGDAARFLGALATGSPPSPTTPTPTPGTPVAGAGPDASAVLGERIRAAVAGLTSGTVAAADALPLTGGGSLGLAWTGFLLVALGLLSRRAGSRRFGALAG